MNSATADCLIEINHRFYAERGRDFSETRARLQAGVRRILWSLKGDETLLDLGCGNGRFAQELSRNGHRGRYVGLDFSAPLLDEARRHSLDFPAQFIRADLMALPPYRSLLEQQARGQSTPLDQLGSEPWSIITAFALMHHIPGRDRRLQLLRQVHASLRSDGQFIHSSWQFSANARVRTRIQPWSKVNLDARELDTGDYLVEWRRGGSGLRYVHEFGESELAELAAASGFRVNATFYSDGADHRSGLYQSWQVA